MTIKSGRRVPKKADIKTNLSDKKVNILTVPDDQILNTIKKNCEQEWLKAVIDFLDNTALRVGELCGERHSYQTKDGIKHHTNRRGIILDDLVNFKHHKMKFKDYMIIVGKGNKERTIPLNKTAKKAAQTLIDYFCSTEHDHLLCPLHRKTISMAIKKAREKAGIHTRITSHTMRHRVLTKLVQKGRIKEAQMIAGHTDPKITLGTYTHVTMEDMKTAIDNL